MSNGLGKGSVFHNADASFPKAQSSAKQGFWKSNVAPSVSLAQPPKSPQCKSVKVWKDGKRKININESNDESDYVKYSQRFLCRDCGFRFPYGKSASTKLGITNRNVSHNTFSEAQFISRELVQREDCFTTHKNGDGHSSSYQVCAERNEAKNWDDSVDTGVVYKNYPCVEIDKSVSRDSPSFFVLFALIVSLVMLEMRR